MADRVTAGIAIGFLIIVYYLFTISIALGWFILVCIMVWVIYYAKEGSKAREEMMNDVRKTIKEIRVFNLYDHRYKKSVAIQKYLKDLDERHQYSFNKDHEIYELVKDIKNQLADEDSRESKENGISEKENISITKGKVDSINDRADIRESDRLEHKTIEKNKVTKYNQTINDYGYNDLGFDFYGKHKNNTMFDSDGFDVNGYDERGFNKQGICNNGTQCDSEGRDAKDNSNMDIEYGYVSTNKIARDAIEERSYVEFVNNDLNLKNITTRQVLENYVLRSNVLEVLSPKNILIIKEHLFESTNGAENLSEATISQMITNIVELYITERNNENLSTFFGDRKDQIKILLTSLQKLINKKTSLEYNVVADLSMIEYDKPLNSDKKLGSRQEAESLNEIEIINERKNKENMSVLYDDKKNQLKILLTILQKLINKKNLLGDNVYSDLSTIGYDKPLNTDEIGQELESSREIVVAEYDTVTEYGNTTISTLPLIIPPRKKLASKTNIYEDMRSVSSESIDIEEYYPESAKLFYSQGKFMENHEDCVSVITEFKKYYPTYNDMSLPQLKYYFSWRTKVRNKEVIKSCNSYAFIYIYEIINQIGVSDSKDGLNKMLYFWYEYRKHDYVLDTYLRNWVKDYVIYYGININWIAVTNSIMKKKIEDSTGNFEDQLISELDNKKYTEVFLKYISRFAKYKVLESKFYKSQWGFTICEALRYVVVALEEHQELTKKENGVDFYLGKIKQEKWKPFNGAVFVHKTINDGHEYVVNKFEKYWVKNNKWYRTKLIQVREKSDDAYLASRIIKSTEAFLRERVEYEYKLSKDIIPSDLLRVIETAVNQYCKEKGIIKKDQTEYMIKSDNIIEPNHIKKIVPEKKIKPTFDISKLNAIRKQSEETREMLTVKEEEELEVFNGNGQESVGLNNCKTEILELKTDVIESGWDQLVNNLTELDEKVLKIFIEQDGIIQRLAKLALANNSLPEILIEKINEQSLIYLGDTIIDMEGPTPKIYEEYMGKIKIKIMGG